MKLHLFCFFFISVWACTDFRYPSNAGVYSARTMDFPFPELVQIKAVGLGEYYNPSLVTWYTNQTYVSFASYGINNTAEGMNNCGLSCAFLTLIETEYQNVTNPNIALGITNLCDYVLGQFCVSDDAKNGLLQLEIYRNDVALGRPCPLVHVSIHDSWGNSAVLEFIRGKQVWHNNQIGILTNDPTYEFHLKNIEQYSYCNNVAPSGNYTINGYTYDPSKLEYSSSNYGVPSDGGSISRFARISQYARFASRPTTTDASVVLGFHMLEKISVAPWYSLFKYEGKMYYTLTIYRVVRDHTNRVIYYMTYNDLVIKMIDIKAITIGTKNIPMEDLNPHNYLDVTDRLVA